MAGFRWEGHIYPAKLSAGKLAVVRPDLTLSTNLDFDKGAPDFQQKGDPG